LGLFYQRNPGSKLLKLALPDFLVGIFEGMAQLLQISEDERLVLMQHPITLLLILFSLNRVN
jgi:hypothetical protein